LPIEPSPSPTPILDPPVKKTSLLTDGRVHVPLVHSFLVNMEILILGSRLYASFIVSTPIMNMGFKCWSRITRKKWIINKNVAYKNCFNMREIMSDVNKYSLTTMSIISKQQQNMNTLIYQNILALMDIHASFLKCEFISMHKGKIFKNTK
jgi:hypothetical protein